MSPDKPWEVKIDIEDGPTEDRRKRRAHSPGSPEKRRSAASRSTTEATTITDQELDSQVGDIIKNNKRFDFNYFFSVCFVVTDGQVVRAGVSDT